MIYFIVCLLASTAGAICGIGGGVIIKPVLDALGMQNVEVISFLSGCTVLSMASYSVVRGKLSGSTKVELRVGLPLAIGAAVGGVIGKWLFVLIKSMSSNPDRVGAVQAICLLLATFGTLLYSLNKSKIKTHKIKNVYVCLCIGILLGMISAFLGIGGGPIKLTVLFYFFSMGTKVAAENSLYIIFFAQTASLLTAIFTGNVPEFSMIVLISMVAGGILGGVFGGAFNKRMKEKSIDRLFIIVMSVIILINVYNAYQFI